MVFTFCARATVMHASANANAAKLFVFFMIYSSPSPPLRKSVKDALLEVGLLTHGQMLTYSPRLPILCGTVASSSRISLPFTVARAVADSHRTSRTPLAHHGYQRREQQRVRNTLSQSLACRKAAKFSRKLQRSALQIAGTIRNANVRSSPARRGRQILLCPRPPLYSPGTTARHTQASHQSLR